MPDRKSFTSKTAASRPERGITVEFDIDGGDVLYARRPKTAAFLGLADTVDGSGIDQVRAARDFMDECLLPESRDLVENRLNDPEDDFDLETVAEIVNWLTGEFTQRPPTRPTASSPPRKRTGSRSTARSRSKVSTPADSTPNGS